MPGWQYPRCYRHVWVISPGYVMVMMHGGHEPSGPHDFGALKHDITSVKQSRIQQAEEYIDEGRSYFTSFDHLSLGNRVKIHLVKTCFIIEKYLDSRLFIICEHMTRC